MARGSRTQDETQVTEQTQDEAQVTEQTQDGEQTQDETTDASELDLDFIATGSFILAADLTKVSAPQRERSPKQAAMDTKVKGMHDHWIAVGRPSQWGRLVETKCVTTYFVTPDRSAEIKKLVNRAVALHGTRARYGSSFVVTPEMQGRFNLPESYIGREAISFAVMDKRERRSGDATAATSDATTDEQTEE